MTITRRSAVFGTAIVLAASAAFAGEATLTSPVTIAPGEIAWTDAPPSLPEGAEIAVLAGSLSGKDTRTFRLRLPDGYSVPPHGHPLREHVTVVDGTLMLGLGRTAKEDEMRALGPGAYHVLPAGDHHYVRAYGETVVQVQGVGPFGIEYVNAADDPRKGG